MATNILWTHEGGSCELDTRHAPMTDRNLDNVRHCWLMIVDWCSTLVRPKTNMQHLFSSSSLDRNSLNDSALFCAHLPLPTPAIAPTRRICPLSFGSAMQCPWLYFELVQLGSVGCTQLRVETVRAAIASGLRTPRSQTAPAVNRTDDWRS